MLKLEPLARNSVKDHKSEIDLPPELRLALNSEQQYNTKQEQAKAKAKESDGNGDGSTIKFCGSNEWLESHISCEKRAQFLVSRYQASEQDAKSSLLGSGCQCNAQHQESKGGVMMMDKTTTATNLRNSSKAKAKTLDTNIVSVILLSLMTIIVIPKFLCLPLPANISWQSIRAQFCTSLILHFQGLMTLQTNDGRTLAMLQGVAGAGLEGIFLLSLMITLLSKRRLWANGLVCLLGIVTIMFLYSTVTFMRKTGSPTLPEMFVVILGLREARSLIKAEGVEDMRGMINGLLGAYVSALPSAFLVWREGRRECKATAANGTEQRRRSMLYFSVLFMALVIIYCSDAWAPIFHMYASVCGSVIFSPPGSYESYIEIMKQGGKPADAAPNLILLIHESLSGEYTMTRKEAVELMPFLQKKFQSNDGEFFVFENARTVSGDTIDCVPAIMSGCLPLNNNKGRAAAYSTNMATQAKMRGYQTLSFSSNALNMKGTKYFMIEDALSINFDRIWHPGVTGEPHVNEAAQSDRLMGKNFKSWIQEWSQNNTLLNNNTTKTPFFAQFYYYDSHRPFYSENKTSNRLDGMLRTVDKGIEDIFSYLDEAGELDNTIVIASGDHGERMGAGGFDLLLISSQQCCTCWTVFPPRMTMMVRLMMTV